MSLPPAISALRPHQWAKNLLVFVPIVAAHKLTAPGILSSYLLLDTLLVFLSFSLCASATYVVNDLCDLDADRLHPVKRARPFAAGALSLKHGAALALACGIVGIGLALLFPTALYRYVGLYVIITISYSLYLKRIPILDIAVLAALYTLRILGAGCALAIAISPWLIAFSMFFFFSLASVKRLAELREARSRGAADVPGRGYGHADLEIVSQCGAASGYISALVLVLYANDPSVTRLYTSPQILWCAAPVLVYWLSRLFLLAHRGQITADPLVFALKDRASYCVALALAACVLAATI